MQNVLQNLKHKSQRKMSLSCLYNKWHTIWYFGVSYNDIYLFQRVPQV